MGKRLEEPDPEDEKVEGEQAEGEVSEDGTVMVAVVWPLGMVAIPVVAAIEAVVQTYWHRYELVDLDDDASLAEVAEAEDEPQPPSRSPPGAP